MAYEILAKVITSDEIIAEFVDDMEEILVGIVMD
jgi:hypothetical protein